MLSALLSLLSLIVSSNTFTFISSYWLIFLIWKVSLSLISNYYCNLSFYFFSVCISTSMLLILELRLPYIFDFILPYKLSSFLEVGRLKSRLT